MSGHIYMHHQGPVGLLPNFGFGLNSYQHSDVNYWSSGAAQQPPSSDSDPQRFSRRLDVYRRKHDNNLVNFERWIYSANEEERRKTATLRQRWLESRTKRTSTTKSKNTVSQRRESTSSLCDSASDLTSKTVLVIHEFTTLSYQLATITCLN